MKKSAIIFVLLFFLTFTSKGQIGITYFSYNNIGNDYTFYLNSYFPFGAGSGGGPKISWVYTSVSNDTVFIQPLYDHRGSWSTFFSSSFDSCKYTNTNTSINYFNVSSNYVTKFGSDTTKVDLDTFWNQHDTTFYIGTASIKEQNAVKVLSIYPNPTSTAISLPIAANELLVYNNYGQVVLQAKDIAAQQSIPVNQLSSGLYFVAVFDKEKNKVGAGKFYKE